MPCPRCGRAVPAEALSCTACVPPTPLYSARFRCSRLYAQPQASTLLPVELHNQGLDPYEVAGLLLNDREFPLDGSLTVTVSPGDLQTLNIPLEAGLPFGRYQVGVKAWFQGRQIDLPVTGPASFELLPFPRFQVPQELELKPSLKFQVRLPLLLENALETAAHLQTLTVLRERPGTLPEELLTVPFTPPVVLSKEKAEMEVGLDFDTAPVRDLAPGKYPGLLRLQDDSGLFLLEQAITLRRYEIPPLKVAAGLWEREIHKYRDLKPGEIIFWRVPAFSTIRKRLHLEIKPAGLDPNFLEPQVTVFLSGVSASPNFLTFPQAEVVVAEKAEAEVEIEAVSAQEFTGGKSPDSEYYVQRGSLIVATHREELTFPVHLRRFEAEPAAWGLSLDFGTTASCVALALPDDQGCDPRHPTACLNAPPLDFDKPAWLLPSAVWRGGGRPLVGSTAAPFQDLARPPKLYLFEEKNEDKRAQHREDVRLIMETCLRRAFEWLADQPRVKKIYFDSFTLSVPTSFPLKWKETLRNICLEAVREVFGGSQVRMVEESMAAIHYFLHHPGVQNQKHQQLLQKTDLIVISDFGGGTTDITFTLKAPDGNEPLTFLPLMHGGMRNFAGHRLDLLLQEKVKTEAGLEVNLVMAERLKKALGNQSEFFSHLGSLGLNERPKQLHLWNSLHEAVGSEVRTRFRNSFKAMLEKVSRKGKLPARPEPLGVLLLLAGNGSHLADFPEHVRAAWKEATQDLTPALEAIAVQRLPEPKKCVALGSYLAALQKDPALSQLHNTIPEDIYLRVGAGFRPPARERLREDPGTTYYLLFETGDPFDDGGRATLRLPWPASLGTSFEIYTCLPGEDLELYDTLTLRTYGAGTIPEEVVFTYSPQEEGTLVTVNWGY